MFLTGLTALFTVASFASAMAGTAEALFAARPVNVEERWATPPPRSRHHPRLPREATARPLSCCLGCGLAVQQPAGHRRPGCCRSNEVLAMGSMIFFMRHSAVGAALAIAPSSRSVPADTRKPRWSWFYLRLTLSSPPYGACGAIRVRHHSGRRCTGFLDPRPRCSRWSASLASPDSPPSEFLSAP